MKKEIFWETEEDGTLVATMNFGRNGYMAIFITERTDDYEVEIQCFNSRGEGYDGRYLYFETEDECKWFVELMADTLPIAREEPQE